MKLLSKQNFVNFLDGAFEYFSISCPSVISILWLEEGTFSTSHLVWLLLIDTALLTATLHFMIQKNIFSKYLSKSQGICSVVVLFVLYYIISLLNDYIWGFSGIALPIVIMIGVLLFWVISRTKAS